MPLVNVMVNSRAYTIACDDGEEEHLKELAAHVDAKAREVLNAVGNPPSASSDWRAGRCSSVTAASRSPSM